MNDTKSGEVVDNSAEEVKELSKPELFLNDYKELVKKHNVDLANYPVYVPDENGGFRTMIQTTPVDLDTLKKPEAVDKPFVAGVAGVAGVETSTEDATATDPVKDSSSKSAVGK